MIKILLVAGQTTGFGGVETVLKKFYTLLDKDNNFDCKFLICGTPKSKSSLVWLENIDHKLIATRLYSRALVKLSSQFQIASYIKKERPDVIIGYDAFGVETSRRAIKLSGFKVNLISWPHFSFDSFSGKNKKRFSVADYHFAICDEIKSQMHHYGIDESKIYIVHNPTARIEHTISRSLNVTKFLYVGRVQYQGQKNLKELFVALSMMQGEFSLDIVGSGDEDDLLKLRELANELNINDKIHFHGWQTSPWEYVQHNIKDVTALVMTSTYEGPN